MSYTESYTMEPSPVRSSLPDASKQKYTRPMNKNTNASWLAYYKANSPHTFVYILSCNYVVLSLANNVGQSGKKSETRRSLGI